MPKRAKAFLDTELLKATLTAFTSNAERMAYVQGLNTGLDIGTEIFSAGLEEILRSLPAKIEAAMSNSEDTPTDIEQNTLPKDFDVKLSHELNNLFRKLRNPKGEKGGT